jgi:hypothetical protein
VCGGAPIDWNRHGRRQLELVQGRQGFGRASRKGIVAPSHGGIEATFASEMNRTKRSGSRYVNRARTENSFNDR